MRCQLEGDAGKLEVLPPCEAAFASNALTMPRTAAVGRVLRGGQWKRQYLPGFHCLPSSLRALKGRSLSLVA